MSDHEPQVGVLTFHKVCEPQLTVFCFDVHVYFNSKLFLSFFSCGFPLMRWGKVASDFLMLKISITRRVRETLQGR